MTAIATRLKTYWALNPINIARVALYRVRTKLGLFRRSASENLPANPVFFLPSQLPLVKADASKTWQTSGLLFGILTFPVSDSPPDWMANPLTGKKFPKAHRIWWKIPDFDSAVGDIKLIWELSRLSWTLPMAQRARNGDSLSLDRLNHWLADWCHTNPPYRGPNWKCGQEASIRVMHLAMSALILGQTRAEPALCILVKQHLERIRPTVRYATAQANNHATSEAAALFIGGSWLVANGYSSAKSIADAGRHALERNVATLVSDDGSFSQHSLNYHRVLLDTLTMCELWRREISLDAFSNRFNQRASAAADWLRHFIVNENGDAPNLGANDGARLLPLADSEYRDFRYSCQLATALFCDGRAFDDDLLDNVNAWVGIDTPTRLMPPTNSKQFIDGGYTILKKGGATALIRFPRDRFRPSQCDAMHVDFWIHGKAMLRDGGTYSYNDGDEWLEYFSGDAGHNSIQFDNSPQMPRLGRFLFGDWLNAHIVDPLHEDETVAGFGAKYVKLDGISHERRVHLHQDRFEIFDEVRGFESEALIRWRLAPADWTIIDRQIVGRDMTIEIQCAAQSFALEMHEGFESTHYMQKMALPVLHVSVTEPTSIKTVFRWTT